MDTQEDALIVCAMGRGLWTSAGHFILLWNVENGIAYINDPASTDTNRLENSYEYMASQCYQYFCFNKKLETIQNVMNNVELINDNPLLHFTKSQQIIFN